MSYKSSEILEASFHRLSFRQDEELSRRVDPHLRHRGGHLSDVLVTSGAAREGAEQTGDFQGRLTRGKSRMPERPLNRA